MCRYRTDARGQIEERTGFSTPKDATDLEWTVRV
jgi:hypothetical protein